MFEHCDAHTAALVDHALDEARRFGHHYLGTEHLLLAVVERRELLPDAVAGLLPPPEAVREVLAAEVGEPARRDAELLKVVGVDLDQVRSAVRRTFGSDALDRLGRRRVYQPWQPWRRPSRRCTSLLAGTVNVAPRVKEALQRAVSYAEQRHADLIDPAALLLGMLEVEGARSSELLRRAGVDPEAIRDSLVGARGD